MKSFDEIASLVRLNEVGRRARIETPFGWRLLCYADLTATGRYLHFVEAWFRQMRPFYANSHTAVSSTGRVMTQLREEARRRVKRGVNASDDDVVLFTGSGATAAVHKLVGLLGIRIPEPIDRAWDLQKYIPDIERPVVFVGPYEHHSNELPWLESICDVVEVPLNEAGEICLESLAKKLSVYASRPLKIGTFSAASNVTGVLTDVKAVSRILHQHGALAFFDYACAGPYVPIDMNPEAPEERIDALFLSPHKFMGGPGASGVLVAHRSLFRTRTPERPGGGTVDYVAGSRRGSVDYASRLEEREEGGTPAIPGDLRAGVCFVVKELLGAERLREHELDVARYALERLSKHPRIKLLGPVDLPRLPIISFNVDGMHHDLVSALLDHLFGIQNRAGCSCAGPYGHRLLGIDEATSQAYREQIARGFHGIKPGWVRVSLPYYASKEDIEFILSGIEFVAERGEDFVPAYRFGLADGVWRHIERPMTDVRPLEITSESLLESAVHFAAGDHETPLSESLLQSERARYFQEARIAADALRLQWKQSPPDWNPSLDIPGIDELVWFRYVSFDRSAQSNASTSS